MEAPCCEMSRLPSLARGSGPSGGRAKQRRRAHDVVAEPLGEPVDHPGQPLAPDRVRIEQRELPGAGWAEPRGRESDQTHGLIELLPLEQRVGTTVELE